MTRPVSHADPAGLGAATPPGLPDDLFARGEVPMTKSEVRALTLARAWLRPADRVLDVGAGSGSLTVEAGLLCPHGEVVALERAAEAVSLIRDNIARFGLQEGRGTGSIRIVAGEAPDAFAGLGVFDRVLLGGSGGRLTAILAALPDLLRRGGRLVANTICLETTAALAEALRQPPWTQFECVQISVARAVPAGPRLRFEALNPVWVSAATLGSPAWPGVPPTADTDRRCCSRAHHQGDR